MTDNGSRNFILITIAVLALGTALSNHNKTQPHTTVQWISLATYPQSKPQHRMFGDLAEFVDNFHIHLNTSGKTETLAAGAVQPNFFQMIGVEPVLGRTFESGEDSRAHVVMVSYRLWQGHFRGATRVVGRTITLDGEAYQVVGVLPSDFSWNDHETDVWMPCHGADKNSVEREI